MKKLLTLVISICLSALLQAQVSKTVTVTAGGLSTALTINEKVSVTNLTIKGTIDARDFKTMRDSMPLLTNIDLSQAGINAYTGTLGTADSTNIAYSASVIPKFAFNGKTNITSVVIPPSGTSIGDEAFYGCTGLTSISIPLSYIAIGNYAFGGCSGLTSLTIPFSVTSIGTQSFFKCSGLSSITISSSISSIGMQAFDFCSSLESIYSFSSIPVNLSASSGVFSNVPTTTCILYVPTGSKSAYQLSNQWQDFNNIVEFVPAPQMSPGYLTTVGQSVTFAVKDSATGGIINWYADSTLTTSFGTGNIYTYTPDTIGTFPLYATRTINSLTSQTTTTKVICIKTPCISNIASKYWLYDTVVAPMYKQSLLLQGDGDVDLWSINNGPVVDTATTFILNLGQKDTVFAVHGYDYITVGCEPSNAFEYPVKVTDYLPTFPLDTTVYYLNIGDSYDMSLLSFDETGSQSYQAAMTGKSNKNDIDSVIISPYSPQGAISTMSTEYTIYSIKALKAGIDTLNWNITSSTGSVVPSRIIVHIVDPNNFMAVDSNIAAPQIASNYSVVYNNSVTCSATDSSNGGIITWFADSTLTTSIGTGNSYTFTPDNIGTFPLYATRTVSLAYKGSELTFTLSSVSKPTKTTITCIPRIIVCSNMIAMLNKDTIVVPMYKQSVVLDGLFSENIWSTNGKVIDTATTYTLNLGQKDTVYTVYASNIIPGCPSTEIVEYPVKVTDYLPFISNIYITLGDSADYAVKAPGTLDQETLPGAITLVLESQFPYIRDTTISVITDSLGKIDTLYSMSIEMCKILKVKANKIGVDTLNFLSGIILTDFGDAQLIVHIFNPNNIPAPQISVPNTSTPGTQVTFAVTDSVNGGIITWYSDSALTKSIATGNIYKYLTYSKDTLHLYATRTIGQDTSDFVKMNIVFTCSISVDTVISDTIYSEYSSTKVSLSGYSGNTVWTDINNKQLAANYTYDVNFDKNDTIYTIWATTQTTTCNATVQKFIIKVADYNLPFLNSFDTTIYRSISDIFLFTFKSDYDEGYQWKISKKSTTNYIDTISNTVFRPYPFCCGYPEFNVLKLEANKIGIDTLIWSNIRFDKTIRESKRLIVQVYDPNNIPAPQIASTAPVTYGSTLNLPVIDSTNGGIIKWYADSTLTTSIGTGNSYTFTPDTIGAFSLYVTRTIGSVMSKPTETTITCIPKFVVCSNAVALLKKDTLVVPMYKQSVVLSGNGVEIWSLNGVQDVDTTASYTFILGSKDTTYMVEARNIVPGCPSTVFIDYPVKVTVYLPFINTIDTTIYIKLGNTFDVTFMKSSVDNEIYLKSESNNSAIDTMATTGYNSYNIYTLRTLKVGIDTLTWDYIGITGVPMQLKQIIVHISDTTTKPIICTNPIQLVRKDTLILPMYKQLVELDGNGANMWSINNGQVVDTAATYIFKLGQKDTVYMVYATRNIIPGCPSLIVEYPIKVTDYLPFVNTTDTIIFVKQYDSLDIVLLDGYDWGAHWTKGIETLPGGIDTISSTTFAPKGTCPGCTLYDILSLQAIKTGVDTLVWNEISVTDTISQTKRIIVHINPQGTSDTCPRIVLAPLQVKECSAGNTILSMQIPNTFIYSYQPQNVFPIDTIIHRVIIHRVYLSGIINSYRDTGMTVIFNNGCHVFAESNDTTVTVVQSPSAPITDTIVQCDAGNVPVLRGTASQNSEIYWHDWMVNTIQPQGNGNTFNTGKTAIGTYMFDTYAIDTITGCSSINETIKLEVFDPSLPSISGTVLADGNSFAHGIVQLFEQKGSTYTAVETDSIQADGSFLFKWLDIASYLIRALPNQDESTYLPSYYVSSTTWQDANAVDVQGKITGMSLTLVDYTAATGGSGSIIGNVNTVDTALANPLKAFTAIQMTVMVMQNGQIVNYALTNVDGSYSVQNLPDGTYQVYVEVPGYSMFLQTVTISNGSTATANFMLKDGMITTKLPNVTSDNTVLYPNPTTDKVTICCDRAVERVFVIDLTGVTVIEQKVKVVDVSQLPAGMYFVKMITNNQTIIKTFIKQ